MTIILIDEVLLEMYDLGMRDHFSLMMLFLVFFLAYYTTIPCYSVV